MDFINDSDYLDQHFLVDQDVINSFIALANFQKDDEVVEIGPGEGTLTKIIAPLVKNLTCIEKDLRLKPYLEAIPNITVIYGDVIETDIPNCNKIITALPYSIIEPFIYKVRHLNFDELYMIMGSTYVNSVINKELNNLSLLTNVYFNLTKIEDIPKECFSPMPKTMSSMVKLIPKKEFTKLELLFKNIYELNHKKTKNALVEGLIRVNNITQKESKLFVKKLNIKESILDKEFNLISNEELKELYQKLKITLL